MAQAPRFLKNTSLNIALGTAARSVAADPLLRVMKNLNLGISFAPNNSIVGYRK